ncbi:unnamed protein product [Parnassius apollo]|uniref:(apollo) hypothetical protein n=1 Tax=Parnassius apollo TaxID=110799 RepID=A0A8S3W240_PARAO|nr:unnamed protein product [Parnassius apollo]
MEAEKKLEKQEEKKASKEKRKPTEKKRVQIIKQDQKKERRGNVISDFMSVLEDSDIIDVTDEEYDITRDLYTNFVQNYEPCNEQKDKIFSLYKKSNVVK